MILECGFLTNPTEDRQLNSSSYQKKLAKGIANGVDKYFKQYLFYVVPAFTILSFHAIILDWFVLESMCGLYLAESIYETRLRSIKQK